MENIEGFDFQAMQFDENGNAQSGVEDLAQHIKNQSVTDVIVICHGFRNDENDARGLYSRFLNTFAGNRTRAGVAAQLGTRKFAVGGVFWPSMVFPEPDPSQGSAQSLDSTQDQQRLSALKSAVAPEDGNRIDEMIGLLPAAANDENAQLRLAAHLLSLASKQPVNDGNEFKTALASATAESLRNALLAGSVQVVTAAGGGAGGAGGIPVLAIAPEPDGGAQSFLGNVLGFVPKFLNLTTFLLMFNRCGTVGEVGISQAVRRVKDLSATVRVHLVGHSLGGRAVTACAKALLANPSVKVDSMMLLEAAYSHFGLSAGGTTQGGITHPRGFYRDVIEQKAVKGPILATHSNRDSVVGFAYTSMAAVSLNNAKAFGDEHSAFGGIGRNGVLDTMEAVGQDLNLAGDAYVFSKDKIHNLDGSRVVQGKALIDSHGDVTSAAVTWAFASLVAGT